MSRTKKTGKDARNTVNHRGRLGLKNVWVRRKPKSDCKITVHIQSTKRDSQDNPVQDFIRDDSFVFV